MQREGNLLFYARFSSEDKVAIVYNLLTFFTKVLTLYCRNSLSARYDYTTIWDADKIQGCYCDYPNFGYDCSLRQCPTGDDPLTTGQKNAVQLVECIASGGSFVLHYK